jgi:hypothetical protein
LKNGVYSLADGFSFDTISASIEAKKTVFAYLKTEEVLIPVIRILEKFVAFSAVFSNSNYFVQISNENKVSVRLHRVRNKLSLRLNEEGYYEK